MPKLQLTAAAATLAVLTLLLPLAGCQGESEEKLLASARQFSAARDYKSATIQLKTLLQKNPDSAAARYLLGKTFLDTGDAAAALVELRKAQDLKYAEDQVVPEMARALLMQGDAVKVLAQYAQTRLGAAPAQADLATSLAVAYAMQGQLDKAREAAAAALAANPNHAPASVLQARLKAGANDLEGALAILDGVLAREPGNDRAGTLKGELLWFGRRDEAGALAAFRRVLESHPAAVPAHVAIIGLHSERNRMPEVRTQFEALKKVAPNHPEALLIEAQLALQDGKADLAREISARLLRAVPQNPRVLMVAGSADYRLRAYLQAEAHFVRALQAAPGHAGVRQMLAQTYLRNNQPAKAMDTLAPLLEGGKADGATLAIAGEALLQSGDPRRADQAFQAAAKASPNDPRVRTAVALAQYARGETQLAMEALESIAADDQGSRADLALITARLRANDMAGALKAVDTLQKKMPDRPLPDLLRGRVLFARKDTAGASAAFEAALKKDAKFVPAVAALAGLDLAAGNPEVARKRLQDQVQLDPGNWQAHVALAEITARTGGTPADVAKVLAAAVKANPAQAAPRLAQVDHLLRMGDFPAALAAAQEAKTAVPGNDDVLAALGRAQLAGNDAQQAVGTFSQLLAKQPGDAGHHLRLAEAYALGKDTTAARASLRKALELDPESGAAKRGLAAIALQQGRPDEARQIARDLQKSRPKEAAGFVLEGDVERQQKNWPAAVAAYRKAFTVARGSETVIRLHQALYAGGQRPEADRLAAEWQKEYPKDAAFRYYQGDLAMARADWAAGEAHYRAVLEAQPRNALALNNVAWLMAKQGKPGAVKLAQQANDIMPNRPQLMDTLATALAAEGDGKRAVEVQRQAVALGAKQDPSLRLGLARLYLKSGEKALARAELDELAKLGEQFRAQAEVAELQKLAR